MNNCHEVYATQGSPYFFICDGNKHIHGLGAYPTENSIWTTEEAAREYSLKEMSLDKRKQLSVLFADIFGNFHQIPYIVNN